MNFDGIEITPAQILTAVVTVLGSWLVFKAQTKKSDTDQEVAEITANTELVGGWQALIEAYRADSEELRQRIARLEETQAEVEAYQSYLSKALWDQRRDADKRGITILEVMTIEQWRRRRATT